MRFLLNFGGSGVPYARASGRYKSVRGVRAGNFCPFLARYKKWERVKIFNTLAEEGEEPYMKAGIQTPNPPSPLMYMCVRSLNYLCWSLEYKGDPTAAGGYRIFRIQVTLHVPTMQASKSVMISLLQLQPRLSLLVLSIQIMVGQGPW